MEEFISKKSFRTRILDMIATLGSKKPPSRDENYRTTLMNLDDYLAQPDEDRKIASKLKRLQNFIESHATYYHNKPVRLTEEEILTLLQKKLFIADEAATRRLAYNLHNGSHRATFICMAISRAISMGIDFHGNPDTSLLPQEIVLFMTAFKNTPRLRETAQVDDVALCEWRRLGMFLLSSPESKTVQLRNVGLRIEAMLTSLDEILGPFAEPAHTDDGNERRLENLRRLLQMGADFGVLLFGQPCGWELNWTVRSSDEADRELEILHSGQTHSSKVPEQVAITASSQYQPLRNEPEPQPAPPRQKRRRRLGRSQSMKEKESREQPQRQQCPPSSLQSQIETRGPHSCKGEIEDEALPTSPKDDTAAELRPNEHLAKLPERPQTRSRETRSEKSFLDGPEESRFTAEPPLAAPTNQTARPIIYFPALVKIKDEYGCKLPQPIMVSEPVVDRSFLATF